MSGEIHAVLAARPLTEREAAEYLSLSPATLRNRRSLGLGPAYLKAGKTIRYRVSDLNAFLESEGA